LAQGPLDDDGALGDPLAADREAGPAGLAAPAQRGPNVVETGTA